MERVLNQQVVMKLQQAADLLEQQGANPFRVNAYRRGADTIAHLVGDLNQLIEEKGYEGLLELPSIGKGIANAIWEMATTGRWAQLERLRGELDPVKLLQTVAGIGPEMAHKIHEHLHIDTLEALETAAYDGRLEGIPGIGARRITTLRANLAAMLGRIRQRHTDSEPGGPSIELLLQVDREYREKAKSGLLPRIAPKRFNPEGKAWLPILHIQHAGWHFTAMYSNTARAHELGKTQDWIMVFYYDDHHQEGQCTVVTETHGILLNKRVVRGHESQCREYYFDQQQAVS